MRARNNISVGKVPITPRAENYSQWYLDVINAADLAEYGPTKGTMIVKPMGYLIWERIQKILDDKLKNMGVQNVYFPLLIPEQLLKKEKNHVEGFSPDVAVVTYAGGAKLEESLIVRPTSETVIYDAFSRWIHSHRDLPLIINQWVNVVRWEKRPRLFLRTTEFLWQEGHTAHSTHDEADSWARKVLDLYTWFAEKVMSIPVIPGVKTDSEKFAGAMKTYCIEAMMQDGKALQFATSHNLGQNFSKVFDIQFTNESGVGSFVWQTSWGLSTRTIGGLIMVHGDDRGLVIPPEIAPVQVVIIPIWNSEKTRLVVLKDAEKIHDTLVAHYGNASVILDDRDTRPGPKHYYWEKHGVPIRLEVGPRDIERKEAVSIRRDTSEKRPLKLENITGEVSKLLEDIQQSLYKTAVKFRDENTVEVTQWDDFAKNIELGKFIKAYWDGTDETEKKIKEKTKATIRCIPLHSNESTVGTCVYSGAPTSLKVIFARSY